MGETVNQFLARTSGQQATQPPPMQQQDQYAGLVQAGAQAPPGGQPAWPSLPPPEEEPPAYEQPGQDWGDIPRNALLEAGDIAQGVKAGGTLIGQRLGENFLPTQFNLGAAKSPMDFLGMLPGSNFIGNRTNPITGLKPLIRTGALNANEPGDIDTLKNVAGAVVADYKQRYVDPIGKVLSTAPETRQQGLADLKKTVVTKPISFGLDAMGLAGLPGVRQGIGALGKAGTAVAARVAPTAGARIGAATQKFASRLPEHYAEMIPGTAEATAKAASKALFRAGVGAFDADLQRIINKLTAAMRQVPKAEQDILTSVGPSMDPQTYRALSPAGRQYLKEWRDVSAELRKLLISTGKATEAEVDIAQWGELAKRLIGEGGERLFKEGKISEASRDALHAVRDDQLLQNGALTADGEAAVKTAKEYVAQHGLPDPTYFPLVFEKEIHNLQQMMQEPLAGLASQIRRELGKKVGEETSPQFTGRVRGTREPNFTKNALGGPILRAAQTLQMYHAQDIITKAMAGLKPARGTAPFPMRHFMEQLTKTTGVTTSKTAQALKQMDEFVQLPPQMIRQLKHMSDLATKSYAEELLRTKGGQLWWKLRSNELAMQLGTSVGWAWTNAAQQLGGTYWRMLSSPTRWVPGFLAHAIVMTNPLKLPERLFSSIGKEFTEGPGVRAALAGWQTIKSAGDVLPMAAMTGEQIRNAITKPIFSSAAAMDKYSRTLLATHLLVEEAMAVGGKQGNILQKLMLSMPDMAAVEHGIADPATWARVEKTVGYWNGVYDSMTLADQKAFRALTPYVPFYVQACTMLRASITETATQTAIMNRVAAYLGPIFQDKDIPKTWRENGAVLARDSKGEVMTNDQGQPMMITRADMLLWNQGLDFVQMMRAMTIGKKHEHLEMLPGTAPIKQIMAVPSYLSHYDIMNSREYRDSNLVNEGGNLYDFSEAEEGIADKVLSSPPFENMIAPTLIGQGNVARMQMARQPGYAIDTNFTPMSPFGAVVGPRATGGEPITMQPHDYLWHQFGLKQAPMRMTRDEERDAEARKLRKILRAGAIQGHPLAEIKTPLQEAADKDSITQGKRSRGTKK